MHHRPEGPPSVRLQGALSRWLFPTRPPLHRRGGRLALGTLLGTAVTGLVLCVPIVSGSSAETPVSVDASSSSDARAGKDSPVVMGRDGRPATPGGSTGSDSTATPSEVEAAGTGTSSAAAGSSTGSSPPGTTGAGAGSPTAAPPASEGTSPSSSAGTSSSSADTARQADTSSAAEAAGLSPEEHVLSLVNAARATAGCDALVPDDALADLARRHSADMRKSGELGLLTPEGVSLLDLGGRAAAVDGGESDPAEVVSGWLADPSFGAAILDCGLTAIGVGRVGGPGGPWWTQLLA